MVQRKNRIKELRTSRNLTQLQLSMICECSQENISSYEHGKSNPGIDILRKMSNYFQVDVDYILMTTDIPNHITEDTMKKDEKILIAYYRALDRKKKQKAQAYVSGLFLQDEPSDNK